MFVDAAVSGHVNTVAADVLVDAGVAVNGNAALELSGAITADFGDGAAGSATTTLVSSGTGRADTAAVAGVPGRSRCRSCC